MKRKKLIVALEEVTEISAKPLTRPLIEPLLDTESDAEQMEETAREISDLRASVEEASQEIESLGLLKDTMEESIERDEGLSEQAAEIAEIAIESLCNRLGVDVTKLAMPATESFGKISTRKLATEAVMDSVKNALKAIFDAIVKVVRYVGELIAKFVKSLSLNTEKLEKNVTVLKNAINNVKTEPRESNVESRETVNAFLLPGNNTEITVENVKTIGNDTESLLKMGTVIIVETEHVYEGIEKTTEAISKNSTKNSAVNTLSALINNLESRVVGDSFDNIKSAYDKLSKYGDVGTVRGQLANAQSVVMAVKRSHAATVTTKSVELNIVKQKTEIAKGLRAEALTKVDLLQTIRLTEHLLSTLKDYQSKDAFNKDTTDEHVKIINTLTEAILESDSSDDTVALARDLKFNLDAFSALTELSKVTIPKLAMNTINEMCRYMKASLDAY